MKRYITTLKAEPLIARLSVIQLISYFAAWFSHVAVFTLLVQMGASAFVIAIAASMQFLPGVILAPYSGALIDYLRPKPLMITLLLVEIIATLLFLTVQDASQVWILLALLFVRMGAASFYFTVEMALLPRISKPSNLQNINEIHSLIWSFSYTFGMALSGLVVFWLGVYTAFLIDAFLFVFSLILLYKTEITLGAVGVKRKIIQMWEEAFSYFGKNKEILHLMLIHAAVGLTAYDALVALLAKEIYAHEISVALSIGFINAIRALALTLGPIIFGAWLSHKRFVWMFIWQGTAIIIWALLFDNYYFSLLGSFLAGLFSTVLWSYSYTLLQQKTKKEFYGRMVALNDMMFLFGATATSWYIGASFEVGLTLEILTLILGSMFFLFAFYYAWVRKKFL